MTRTMMLLDAAKVGLMNFNPPTNCGSKNVSCHGTTVPQSNINFQGGQPGSIEGHVHIIDVL